MIDALGNASADGEFDTYPKRLDRDSDDDGIGVINETEIIDGTRVTGQGFGESKLANDCTTLKKCTDLQHEGNRYSEFIVMEYQNNLNQVIHWE